MTPLQKYVRTAARVTLTPAGSALVEDLDRFGDPGWSVADDDRYWYGKRRSLLRVALLVREVRRTPR